MFVFALAHISNVNLSHKIDDLLQEVEDNNSGEEVQARLAELKRLAKTKYHDHTLEVIENILNDQ